jgi:hypothetical protein
VGNYTQTNLVQLPAIIHRVIVAFDMPSSAFAITPQLLCNFITNCITEVLSQLHLYLLILSMLAINEIAYALILGL